MGGDRAKEAADFVKFICKETAPNLLAFCGNILST